MEAPATTATKVAEEKIKSDRDEKRRGENENDGNNAGGADTISGGGRRRRRTVRSDFFSWKSHGEPCRRRGENVGHRPAWKVLTCAAGGHAKREESEGGNV